MKIFQKIIKKQSVSSVFYTNKVISYIIITLFLITCILFLVQTYNRALRIPYGNDFTLFLEASRKFFDISNPYTNYSIFDFIYPQTLCVLIYPLTIINYQSAIFIWIVLNFYALLMSFKYSLEYINSNELKNKYTLFFVLFILLFAIIQDNFLNGQINFIILYLCILFFRYLEKSKNVLASFMLSLAIVIKLTPLIFIIFLILYRKIKTIILTLFFSLILIVIIPALLTSFDFVLSNYKYYLNNFILHRTTNFQEFNLHSRFAFSTILSKIVGKYAMLVSAIISLSYYFYFQLKNKFTLNFLIFSGYLLSILLISPMSEKHHLILALPAILLLILNKSNIKINLSAVIFFIVSSSINNNYLILLSLFALYLGLILNLSKYTLKELKAQNTMLGIKNKSSADILQKLLDKHIANSKDFQQYITSIVFKGKTRTDIGPYLQ